MRFATMYVTNFNGKDRGTPADVAPMVNKLMQQCYGSDPNGPQRHGLRADRCYVLEWRDATIRIAWSVPPQDKASLTRDVLERCAASFHVTIDGDAHAYEDDAEVILNNLMDFRPVAAFDDRTGERMNIDDVLEFYASVDKPPAPLTAGGTHGLLEALDAYNEQTGWTE